MKIRSALPFAWLIAVLFFLCRSTVPVVAQPVDPCLVDFTFDGSTTGFYDWPSINQVLEFNHWQTNPCPLQLGNMTNKAYPACLTLVQGAIAFEEYNVENHWCTGAANGGEDAVIQFGNQQVYDFSNETNSPTGNEPGTALDLGEFDNQTDPPVRLIFQGSWNQTSGYPTTTLVFNNNLVGFSLTHSFNHISYVTISGFVQQEKQDDVDANDPNKSVTINGVSYEMTQGTYVSFQPTFDHNGIVTINITSGFPSPAALFDPTNPGQRYFKLYSNAPDPILHLPQPVHATLWGTVDAPQPPVYCVGGQKVGDDVWSCAPWRTAGTANTWNFVIKQSTWPLPLAPNTIVCIKNKTGWADPYTINDAHGNQSLSSGIVMDHISWVGKSRGAIIGADGISITNSFILRPPSINGQAPCIASSGGGPQIGKYDNGGHVSPYPHSVHIENLVVEAAGDNAINISYDDTPPNPLGPPPSDASHILNSTFDSNWDAPIVLNQSPDVYLMDPGGACTGLGCPVPPTFTTSGDQITNCFTYDNGSGWPYPFNNPSGYTVQQPLCGISGVAEDPKHAPKRRRLN